jgi:hypothetical protein
VIKDCEDDLAVALLTVLPKLGQDGFTSEQLDILRDKLSGDFKGEWRI